MHMPHNTETWRIPENFLASLMFTILNLFKEPISARSPLGPTSDCIESRFQSFFGQSLCARLKYKNVQKVDPIFVRLRFLWCCSILGYHFSFRFLATLLPTTTFPSIFSIFNMLLKLSF
jgi:hypothetical protein